MTQIDPPSQVRTRVAPVSQQDRPLGQAVIAWSAVSRLEPPTSAADWRKGEVPADRAAGQPHAASDACLFVDVAQVVGRGVVADEQLRRDPQSAIAPADEAAAASRARRVLPTP